MWSYMHVALSYVLRLMSYVYVYVYIYVLCLVSIIQKY